MTEPHDAKTTVSDDTAPGRARWSPEVLRFLGITLAGQYRVDAVIGEGGMGVVYRARQLTVGRDVALKIMRRELANDLRAAMRFENEAKIISRLRHPNTLRLYDCQRTSDGDLFLVTELLSGSPLSAILAQQGRLSVDRAVRVADQVCRALAEAHAGGIVHRDLKPANVFIDRVGVDDLVKVLDFGIAKILEGNSGITRAGSVNGTPIYMSPEQSMGKTVDPRSDIYSLGVMLYEMLAGKPPFTGLNAAQILAKHVREPAPPLGAMVRGGAVPEDLERLLASMLEKLPDKRPASVDLVLIELARITGLTREPRPLLETVSDGKPTVPEAPSAAVIPEITSADSETRILAQPVSLAESRSPFDRWRWVALALAAMISAAVASWYVASEPVPHLANTTPVPQVRPPPPQPQLLQAPVKVVETTTRTIAQEPKEPKEPKEPPPQAKAKPKRPARPRLGTSPLPVKID